MSDSVRPHRRQLNRLSHPWDSPGKNTGVGCHFLLQCVKVKLLSRVRLLATPWTAVNQAPPSMGSFRQDCWSGVPLPSLILSFRAPVIIPLQAWLSASFCCMVINDCFSVIVTVEKRSPRLDCSGCVSLVHTPS